VWSAGGAVAGAQGEEEETDGGGDEDDGIHRGNFFSNWIAKWIVCVFNELAGVGVGEWVKSPNRGNGLGVLD
jgi:hypothetical protein